ncbi:glutamine amidotransferase/cyclase [Coccomyxa subellipsoidea C-169]|uniref:Imidazole glycerol phosphate synthase hisHF n=1 Tax=Coccomyxa subellipsoidea (strain C-169) TaxID=574566 RepID=I0YZC3_COCSC|nr:glutamine amidotransferase/cyclase [Coccomyxa subellipsoidea C-169]EIE23742.1 glutamine amidotransferase/cyclase [Coccomyxa subellipsoidea C-169]|eukprot:XP_005648286.1 glutamine amidotransferase/cyclase [Coccomyxa subellipsoidea C-169]
MERLNILNPNVACRQGQTSTSGRIDLGRCSTRRKPSLRGFAVVRNDTIGEVTLLDYGAGNVRSVRNAIKKLGYNLKEVTTAADILSAERLIFPGVGAFEQAMGVLTRKDFVDPLREYIQAGRPFLGICLGMQLLFEGSDENGGVEGLGIIPGRVTQFDTSLGLPVPHIGWNTLEQRQQGRLLSQVGDRRVYFVHSYRATPSPENADWVLATSHYGEDFISAVQKGEVSATQFHPEKSGAAGLAVIQSFMEESPQYIPPSSNAGAARGLAKRVIACLDVRANDAGDLVVTKGDQYDVRETDGEGREVRNLGAPVELAGRYFREGADEVTFLNITGFRDFPLGDLPMLEVLRRASEGVFVPLTVGGGIRGFTDAHGKRHSALDVAAEYFRSGADKVSIGGDAVEAALEYLASGVKTGQTAIEQISWAYGAQAVVVSIDPRRVYVADPADTQRPTVETAIPGPAGERHCWWQCTVKGGREGRDIDAVELARAVQELGAGEILLNCIDRDGRGDGFDLELVEAVSSAVTIPVIASSGAGSPEHFQEVFEATGAAAALAAGIFHRREVSIEDVKTHMSASGIPTRTA